MNTYYKVRHGQYCRTDLLHPEHQYLLADTSFVSLA